MVSHEIARDRRCVFVHLSAQAHFRHMVAHFRDLIRREPDLGTYDYVCDLTDFRGDAFVTDVQAIADEYAPYAAEEVTYTCFATPDPYFGLWTRAMDEMFKGRKHLVFASRDECSAFLDQTRLRT
jgi:hypothetical protein